ncbi:MAG: 5-(carboxyamino)imidazole ribonucleotide mutase [Nitrospiraceae bacterium]|nr:5-(carboxyamino)imidazole ribonucleotide mutase [Nitrospiraceae bacterium]
MKPKVFILMGSDSDLPIMEESARTLEGFGIPYVMTIASAHRTPGRTRTLIEEAETSGVQVIIAGAGMAAHLPGVVASYTTLPVIGVPLDASPLNGMDALLSIVQMPPGIPVATVSIGKPGARNAAILAAQIIAGRDKGVAKKLLAHRAKMHEEVEEKARKFQRNG